jgi:hypothetical protein
MACGVPARPKVDKLPVVLDNETNSVPSVRRKGKKEAWEGCPTVSQSRMGFVGLWTTILAGAENDIVGTYSCLTGFAPVRCEVARAWLRVQDAGTLDAG